MHMSFWWNISFKDFLFEGYTITSVTGLLSTCFGLISLAIILEAVKVYRASLKVKSIGNKSPGINDMERSEGASLQNENHTNLHIRGQQFLDFAKQTIWYIIHDVMSYLLMLSVMTYNGYFTVSVVIGSACGYLIFGPDLIKMRLKMGSLCKRNEKCSVCIQKLEESTRLLKTETNQSSNSLSEVARGLVSDLHENCESHVPVEVHAEQSQCDTTNLNVQRVYRRVSGKTTQVIF